MTIDKLGKIYCNVRSTYYDVECVNDMLTQLNVVVCEHGSGREEKMLLSMICSALKNYCDSSVDAYKDNIMDIIIRLENMYTINGLLPVILDA